MGSIHMNVGLATTALAALTYAPLVLVPVVSCVVMWLLAPSCAVKPARGVAAWIGLPPILGGYIGLLVGANRVARQQPRAAAGGGHRGGV